jgi:acid ceramidase
MKFLLLLALIGSALAFREYGEPAECHMTDSYPPPSDRDLPWFQVNLDAAAEDRWTEVITYFNQTFNHMMYELFKDMCHRQNDPSKCITNQFLEYISGNEDEILARYPYDWADELRGISEVSGIALDELITFNFGYELMGLCTSIVATNLESGVTYHGRNLDFGLFMGVNWTQVQWIFTENLRNCTFNVEMMKSNEVFYKGTFFCGFIGLLTGVRENVMTITVNSRFDDNHDQYWFDWLKNTDDTDWQETFLTRSAIETQNTYQDAINYIHDTPIMSPGYIIIGGPEPFQGAVLSIGPNGTLWDEWDIPEALPANATTKWYVLETNYDHWEQPPWFDDRRYPAEDCMAEVGGDNIDIATLYNVLDGVPNRNRLTTYTALMQCSTGHLEGYKQYCEEKYCIPW